MRIRTLGAVIGVLFTLAFSIAAPVQAQTKLSHRAKDALNRQARNLAEIEKAIERVKSTAECAGLTSRMDTILIDLKKNECPEDCPEMAAVKARLDGFRAAIAASSAKLKTGEDAHAKAADLGTWPDYRTDMEKLDAINKGYGINNFEVKIETTRKLVLGYKDAAEYVIGRAKVYLPLVETKTNDAVRMDRAISAAYATLKKFRDNEQKFVGEAAAEVQKSLVAAKKFADEGREKKNPNYFNKSGGIEQQMGIATRHVATLEVMTKADDPGLVKLKDACKTTRAYVDAARGDLREQCIAQQPMPEDLYAGADKSALEAMVRKEWTKKWPSDQVVGIRFHMQNWKRDEEATWQPANKSWHMSDTSVLCVTVAVKTSDKVLSLYPAYLNRDNQAGGTPTPGCDTKGDTYVVNEMLAANWKP